MDQGKHSASIVEGMCCFKLADTVQSSFLFLQLTDGNQHSLSDNGRLPFRKRTIGSINSQARSS